MFRRYQKELTDTVSLLTQMMLKEIIKMLQFWPGRWLSQDRLLKWVHHNSSVRWILLWTVMNFFRYPRLFKIGNSCPCSNQAKYLASVGWKSKDSFTLFKVFEILRYLYMRIIPNCKNCSLRDSDVSIWRQLSGTTLKYHC